MALENRPLSVFALEIWPLSVFALENWPLSVFALEFRKRLKTKWVSNDRSRRDDSESGRIVKIGAILLW